MNMQPLIVTAYMRTNVVSDVWLTLDGMLYYYAMMDRYGEFPSERPAEPNDLPLDVRGEGSDWYYTCSLPHPHPWWIDEGTSYLNNRFDQEFIDYLDMGKKRIVQTIGGEFKQKHMPIFYKVVPIIQWYCVGDRDRIIYLLANATHIGKYQAHGWGRVARWTVEPSFSDLSVWCNDEPMRAIPASGVKRDGCERAYLAIRPPYYLKEHLRDVIVPRTKIPDWFDGID